MAQVEAMQISRVGPVPVVPVGPGKVSIPYPYPETIQLPGQIPGHLAVMEEMEAEAVKVMVAAADTLAAGKVDAEPEVLTIIILTEPMA